MSSTINATDLQAYLNHLEATNTLGDTVGFGYTDGKKYYRVYREINSGSKSIISFVEKQHGTIYKAKGWDSASKTSLGNISDYRVEDQVHPDPEIQVHPEVESQEEPQIQTEWFLVTPGQDPTGPFTERDDAVAYATAQGIDGYWNIRDRQYLEGLYKQAVLTGEDSPVKLAPQPMPVQAPLPVKTEAPEPIQIEELEDLIRSYFDCRYHDSLLKKIWDDGFGEYQLCQFKQNYDIVIPEWTPAFQQIWDVTTRELIDAKEYCCTRENGERYYVFARDSWEAVSKIADRFPHDENIKAHEIGTPEKVSTENECESEGAIALEEKLEADVATADAEDKLIQMLAEGLSEIVSTKKPETGKAIEESVTPSYREQLINYLEHQASCGDEMAKTLLAGIDELTYVKSSTKKAKPVKNLGSGKGKVDPASKVQELEAIAAEVAQTNKTAVARRMNVMPSYIQEIMTAYQDVYLRSETVQQAFKEGRLTWSKICKASRKVRKLGIEQIEQMLLA